MGIPERTDHPHEISVADLEAMYAMTPDRSALQEVVSKSREHIGFFPMHNPRALEYPWILAQLPQQLTGRRILDVGAGVNVVPFMLAERGAEVTTLDNHATITRDPSNRRDWNEWGFLDYALIDPRIRSVHAAFESWSASNRFDTIYSISVIEHLPRAVRLLWIEKFRQQLNQDGLLLLTVDLERDSDLLYNICGTTIEDPKVHGDFAMLLDELRHAGFRRIETRVQRGVPNCRVDIGFIVAV